MLAATQTPKAVTWIEGRSHLRLQDVSAPMCVVGLDNKIEDLTLPAQTLLARFELPSARGEVLPPALVAELDAALLGDAVMWRTRSEGPVLGVTRYRLGDRHHLCVMREVTDQQRAISQRLHQQRLQETGKLVAHVVHDLRAPLSSIVYNADLLRMRGGRTTTNELVCEIYVAADNLRRTIAGLLDFVRLGPPVHAETSLREVCDRVSSLLRPMVRAGGHELTIQLHDDSVCLSGNPIGIEQIFVNLLVNAMEASATPVKIQITSAPAPTGPSRSWRAQDAVLIRVQDNGPGVPYERRDSVFEAYVTSKPNGTGLGLTITREAVLSLGGSLWLEDTLTGASFAMVLPTVKTEVSP